MLILPVLIRLTSGKLIKRDVLFVRAEDGDSQGSKSGIIVFFTCNPNGNTLPVFLCMCV